MALRLTREQRENVQSKEGKKDKDSRSNSRIERRMREHALHIDCETLGKERKCTQVCTWKETEGKSTEANVPVRRETIWTGRSKWREDSRSSRHQALRETIRKSY